MYNESRWLNFRWFRAFPHAHHARNLMHSKFLNTCINTFILQTSKSTKLCPHEPIYKLAILLNWPKYIVIFLMICIIIYSFKIKLFINTLNYSIIKLLLTCNQNPNKPRKLTPKIWRVICWPTQPPYKNQKFGIAFAFIKQ